MAFNRLFAVFRQVTINRQSNNIVRCFSNVSKEQNNIQPFFTFKNVTKTTHPSLNIRFAPRTLNITFDTPNNITKTIIESPIKYIPTMEDPLQRSIKQDIPIKNEIIDLPTVENTFEKHAVRLIVIRRKKMKKHQRRKWRKKMKSKLEKVRARRNILKEKAFENEILSMIKQAEQFDAKAYVEEKLHELRKERLPLTFRGEVLPPQQIKQFLEEQKERIEKRKKPRARLTLD